MEPLWLSVKVHTKAKKELLLQLGPDRFEVWVKAKPIAGEANAAVGNMMARALGVPRHRLRLIKGRAGRHKVFKVI